MLQNCDDHESTMADLKIIKIKQKNLKCFLNVHIRKFCETPATYCGRGLETYICQIFRPLDLLIKIKNLTTNYLFTQNKF